MAQLKLGVRVAASLKARLSDIRSAASLSELIVGRLRQATEDSPGDLLLDLAEGSRMLLRINHNKPPLRADGLPDWSRVTRVMIREVQEGDA